MHDFTILVAPGAFASAVAVTVDLLSAAAAIAPRLKMSPPTWKLRALAPGPVQLSNGLSIAAPPLARSRGPDRSIWVVPGLSTHTTTAVDHRLAQADVIAALPLLRYHVNKGGTVAASCSGVFLLQEAGLLVDRKVTTSW